MNVPALRFKDDGGGYFPEWELRALIDVCNKILDGTHFSPKSIEGQRKYLTSKNVRNTGVDLANVNYISEEEHKEIYKKCPVKYGDILLTKDGANTGNCCLNSLHEEFSLLSSVAVLSGKFGVLLNPFLLQTLQSSFGINTINNAMAGQAISRITLEKIKKFKFNFPSFEEQTKIANFLTAVDEKITHFTQKHNLLTQYKKGVMQQIFSQELRFKDDDGRDFPEWEEKALSDVGKSFNGLVGKSGDDFGSGQCYITYKQIFDSSKIDVNKFSFVEIGENENQNKVTLGDVFFTTSSETPNEVGFCSVLLSHVNDVYLNSFCFGYRINSFEILSPLFAQFLFHSSSFRENVIKLAQGSTRYNISKVSFMETRVQLPCIHEQTKIANFLTAIDDKINTTQTQLEAVKQYKKGLLQQMFV